MNTKYIKYILLFCFFVLPFITFSASIYSATDSSTLSSSETANNSFGVSTTYQTLGTGLSGTFKYLDTYASCSSNCSSSGNLIIALYEFSSSCYAVACYVQNWVFYSASTSASTKTLIQGVYSSGVTLDPSKYYYIRYAYDGARHHKIYGSSSSSYANGTTSFSGVSDTYFVLYADSTTSGSFNISSPSQNQITSSPLVDVTFTYYNNSVTDYYDKVGISAVNSTDNQTLNLSNYEQNITSSGSATFSVPVLFPSNKQIILRAYMRSSTASSTTIYSMPRIFTTVSSPYSQTTLPSSGIISGVSGVGTTTSYSVSTTTGGIGTTTLNYFTPCDYLPSEVCSVLQTRFPFSYLFDAFVIVGELAQGSSRANATFTLPLGAVFTNPSTGVSTSTITLIDKSAIVNTGYLTDIRNLVEYSIYLGTVLYLLPVIMSAL